MLRVVDLVVVIAYCVCLRAALLRSLTHRFPFTFLLFPLRSPRWVECPSCLETRACVRVPAGLKARRAWTFCLVLGSVIHSPIHIPLRICHGRLFTHTLRRPLVSSHSLPLSLPLSISFSLSICRFPHLSISHCTITPHPPTHAPQPKVPSPKSNLRFIYSQLPTRSLARSAVTPAGRVASRESLAYRYRTHNCP